MSHWYCLLTTAFIRLAAARLYSAGDVEASDPDIIMRHCAGKYQQRPRGLRNPNQLRRRELTATLWASSEM